MNQQTSKPICTIEDYIAVCCEKYDDKPLLGKVTGTEETFVMIDWMVGTYSGTWREWRGRKEGREKRCFLRYHTIL